MNRAPQPPRRPTNPARREPAPRTQPTTAPARPEEAGVRLSKRVMAVAGCSRSEAERLIECGRVTVNGQVCTEVPHRVLDEQVVAIAPASAASGPATATVLLHLLAGLATDWTTCLAPANEYTLTHPPLPGATTAQAAQPVSAWLRRLRLAVPLSTHTAAPHQIAPSAQPALSGLVILSNAPGMLRCLLDDEVLPEQEWLLTATGTVSPEQLEASRQAWARPAPLGTGARDPEGPLPPRRTDGFLRLSVSHTQPTVTGLRAVFRGNQWERLADALAQAQVSLQSARRLRVGRVGLRDLPPGQWRQLQRYERF